MKLAPALIAAVSLLASCKDRPREGPPAPAPAAAPAPGSGAPSAAPPAPAPSADRAPPAAPAGPVPDVCRMGLDALGRAACPTPEAQQSLADAKQSIDGIIETLGKVGSADQRQFQVVCGQLLLAIEQDAAKLGCTVPIEPARRKEIAALLEAWYGQRTAVVPTGHAAADAVIAKIAAVRDAACACRDRPCLEALQQQLGAVGEMPKAAPDAAKLLGSKLLEDAGRCAARVRTQGPPPPQGPAPR